jgi:replicative DNA helicase
MEIFNLITNPIKSYFEEKKRKKKEKQKLKLPPNYVSFKELKKISGNLQDFESFLQEKGKIGIVVGARGTGKSALGMRIAENIFSKSNNKIFALGFHPEKVPRYMNVISNLKEIENESFLIVDESGIKFSSRSSMSSANKLLSSLLFISRHKNISILFITQNSSNIEVNTLRQADYLLFKKSSLLQLDFERKKIKEIYQETKKDFEKFNNDKGLTYIYSDLYRGFVSNFLPSFWTEGLSRSFSETMI